MAENLVTYCVVHQPRRVKLPAQVIPRGTKPADMAGYLFDDVMNKRYFDKVAKWCYYPATKMFLDMLDQGYKLGIGFSVSFLMAAAALGQGTHRALQDAGGPSQLRAGRRGALSQFRFCPGYQALSEGDETGKGFRGRLLRQRDPGHRHHRDGDEQRDLLRPHAVRLQRRRARRAQVGHGLAGDHPSLQLRRAGVRPVLPAPRTVRRRGLPLQQQDLAGLPAARRRVR